MVAKAKSLSMPAVALTDIGNLYGAFKFVREAITQELKPIVGCEFYLADDRKKLKFTKDNPDKRYNQVLIAKNKDGYHNLAKLSSFGFLEGLYGIYPRIDKALVEEYHKDLIATTGGLSSEVPHLILNVGEKQAEDAFKWWHNLFGDDFYIELNRHGIPEEDHVNSVLLRFAEKHGVKYFAANESFYLDKEEANAHDVLLCIKEGEFQSTPIGYGRGHRYGLQNQEYYYKSPEEMKTLFGDLPESILTIEEILNKIERNSKPKTIFFVTSLTREREKNTPRSRHKSRTDSISNWRQSRRPDIPDTFLLSRISLRRPERWAFPWGPAVVPQPDPQ
jgi:DNA polymerase-3 subunit alpha